MRTRLSSCRFVRFGIPPIIALCLILITAASLQATPLPPVHPIGLRHLPDRSASAATLHGWFSVFWADGKPGTHLNFEEYWLTDDVGHLVRLRVDPALLEALGGSLALNGQLVQVEGTRLPDNSLHITTVRIDSLPRRPNAPALSSVHKPDVLGPQPWITLLCKFSDIITETKPVSYFTQMYASTSPGLDHYWREQSYSQANVAGSGSVAHWYTLPHPRSYYLLADDMPDTNKLLQDCTAAVDADVYFPNFVGFNMMFNGDFSVGVGGYGTLTLDGVTRTWYRTWEPEWGFLNIAVMEHEMGHGFGLPHSSGNYGRTYDNVWDVMSDTWSNCFRLDDPVYGCVGQHTIGWHKDKQGWIAANRKAVIPAGSSTTITLEQLALPQTGSYLMAQVPVKGAADRFYTLEARRKVGYDVQLPGEGVIIHYVEAGRANPARVIDIDNNGNTGDAGAIWLPGETYVDNVNGITVTVLSATATGYIIGVDNRSFATRYYVAATGSDGGNPCTNSATPCATVQHAVDVADAGGEIRIAAGTYAGVSVRGGITQAVYLSKTVTLRGGYTTSDWNNAYPVTQATTLDAQGQGRVIYIDNGQPMLDGLRLLNGTAIGLGGAWGDGGGGVYIDNGAAPVIRACTIGGSQAEMGGGVFVVQSAVILENNTIVSNTASMYGGGALVLFADASTLSGNVFRANQGYEGGGLYLYDSSSRLTNNVLANNTATWNGSGLYIRQSAPQLWHTTVARNSGGSGHGIYLNNSSVGLTNTILVSQALGLKAAAGSTATLAATLWGSGAWANFTDWNGPGSVLIGSVNIHDDPAFLSPAAGDYHLAPTSAAIDQGVETGITIDIDNQARPAGSAPDLGADEWRSLVNLAPLAPANPSPPDNETGVWVRQMLMWQGSDPDGDPLTYTVALSVNDPPAVVGQTLVKLFNPGQLLTSTHYFWQITATDGLSITVGPVWEFTTASEVIVYDIYLPIVRR